MEPRVLCLLAITLAAAVVDVRTSRIPNALNLFAWVTGLGTALLAPVLGLAWPVGGVEALLTSVGALGLGLLVYHGTRIGGGDVKLGVALSAWLGPVASVEVLLYSTVGATVLVLLLALRRGRAAALARTVLATAGGALFPPLREQADEELVSQHLPLGVAVFLGVCTWVCVATPGL